MHHDELKAVKEFNLWTMLKDLGRIALDISTNSPNLAADIMQLLVDLGIAVTHPVYVALNKIANPGA